MKDGTAAYKVLWTIKKKLATHGDGVPATPTKKGGKRATTDDGDANAEDGKGSAKKKRKTPTKSLPVLTKEDMDDEEEDNKDVKTEDGAAAI